MLKTEETNNTASTWNAAFGDEPMFIMLARDPVAADIVKKWAEARIAAGLNKPTDPEIVTARTMALLMHSSQDKYAKAARAERLRGILSHLGRLVNGEGVHDVYKCTTQLEAEERLQREFVEIEAWLLPGRGLAPITEGVLEAYGFTAFHGSGVALAIPGPNANWVTYLFRSNTGAWFIGSMRNDEASTYAHVAVSCPPTTVSELRQLICGLGGRVGGVA